MTFRLFDVHHHPPPHPVTLLTCRETNELINQLSAEVINASKIVSSCFCKSSKIDITNNGRFNLGQIIRCNLGVSLWRKTCLLLLFTFIVIIIISTVGFMPGILIILTNIIVNVISNNVTIFSIVFLISNNTASLLEWFVAIFLINTSNM